VTSITKISQFLAAIPHVSFAQFDEYLAPHMCALAECYRLKHMVVAPISGVVASPTFWGRKMLAFR